jgi:hypothetical protein
VKSDVEWTLNNNKNRRNKETKKLHQQRVQSTGALSTSSSLSTKITRAVTIMEEQEQKQKQ